MRKFPYKNLVWITAFAIAMGFLETSVVIYLRALLYPQGFVFPLVTMPEPLMVTEILREAATIIMLIAIGVLTGKSFAGKFAWFIYTFAIWDIFYYVFLKLLLNWPESFMTWDILFLIPLSWVGPVLTPIIVSVTMIFFALIIIYFENKFEKITLKPLEWTLLIAGSIILITGFVWDYSAFILEHYSLLQLGLVPKDKLYELAFTFVPRSFNWWLFWIGEATIVLGIIKFAQRNKNIHR